MKELRKGSRYIREGTWDLFMLGREIGNSGRTQDKCRHTHTNGAPALHILYGLVIMALNLHPM